jgi:hypothetical protein
LNKKYYFLLIPLLVGFLLTIPAIGNILSPENFKWSKSDFIIAGVFLLILGFYIYFILFFIKGRFRILILSLLFILFWLLWVELAVGIFDSPISGQ